MLQDIFIFFLIKVEINLSYVSFTLASCMGCELEINLRE